MKTRSINPTRRRALGLFGAALIVPRAAFAADLSVLSGRAFGSSWRLFSPGRQDLAPLGPRIEELFAGIDRCFSPWRPDSTISRFNALSAGAHFSDRDLAQVTGHALAIARQSEGAFDPTVGPLVARWGFGPIRTGEASDWRAIAVTPETVAKSRHDLTLDLCGIAKGWALDRAGALVAAAGIDSFLFELGGEFMAMGQHPDARDWRLAVDTPQGTSPVLRVPDHVAAATSGLWEQSYLLGDRIYSHIIDPATSEPVSGTLRSVSVLADSAITADGWATALCAAGADRGPELARSLDLAALFLIEDGASLRQVATRRIREFIV